MLKHILLMVILLIQWLTLAAPYPATSSSVIITNKRKLYDSPSGFKLDASQTVWEQFFITGKTSAITIFAPPGQVTLDTGFLSIRTTNINTEANLTDYAKSWITEYVALGFIVLGSQFFSLSSKNRGLAIDLINKDKSKKLRQVVFLKNQQSVILTCVASQTTFIEVLPICNQIIRSFEWTL